MDVLSMKHASTLLAVLFMLANIALANIAYSAQPVSGPVVAEVNGQTITEDELERAVGPALQKLQEQIYSMKRQRLNAMIAERLVNAEAAKRGVTVPQLLDAEVTPKIGLVTEQELDTFFNANRGSFGNAEDGRERARAYLQAQKRLAATESYIQSLQARSKVVIDLVAPPVVRANVPVNGGIAKGSDKAPVTIVEFTDFDCPFCKRVRPTVADLLAKYGDKVRYVHHDFPIEKLHPGATRAHLAARCADDQGKFWPYHDKIFAGSESADPARLKTYAKELGLDLVAFEQCLATSKHQAIVQSDIETGQRLGITGTPTFFINGRMLLGAQPLQAFAEVIDQELSGKAAVAATRTNP